MADVCIVSVWWLFGWSVCDFISDVLIEICLLSVDWFTYVLCFDWLMSVLCWFVNVCALLWLVDVWALTTSRLICLRNVYRWLVAAGELVCGGPGESAAGAELGVWAGAAPEALEDPVVARQGVAVAWGVDQAAEERRGEWDQPMANARRNPETRVSLRNRASLRIIGGLSP